jgi:type 1 glutamine amidotransferase
MLFGKNPSRRSLVRDVGIAAGTGLLGLAASDSVQSQPMRGKPRALALVGDRYHNPDYIRVSLDKVFQELDIPVDYTIAYDQISAAQLKNYQLLLIFRDGMIWPAGYLGPDAYTDYEADLETPKTFADPVPVMWMKEEQGAAIKDFVNQVGGFYAMHNCSHISLSSKNYREVMGGAYIGHPPLRPFQVRATQNKHPITDGIAPFMVNDEQHYVAYDKDPQHIILEAENVDGLKYEALGTKSVSGWAYDFGKGRVVFTAVGHNIHAMWNPQYLEVQKRSLRWLLRQI